MAVSPSGSSAADVKAGVVLLAVTGTAVALNLTVMGLGAVPADEEATAPTATASTQPQLRQIVVDVPVIDGPNATAGGDSETAQALTSTNPTPAAPNAPLATVAPTAAPPPTGPPATAPATTRTPSTTAPATAPPTSFGSTAAPTTAAATTQYLTYRFDGIAEIVIADHAGHTLEFWSVTPEVGWAFQVEASSADKVKIDFRRTSGDEGEAEFVVKREGGQLEVKKER